jgi:ABC-type antimicrobial peptide transport system permease subunit
MQLAAAFAAIALALTCIGVYGVLAYAVARRRHEFGGRLALGALPRQVMADVMREGLTLALAGSAAGVTLALIVSRLLGAQLYGIGAHDPASYLMTIALLGLAATGACWIPARRATAVSPMESLRVD